MQPEYTRPGTTLRESTMAELLTLGIDVGSTTSKCVILRDGAELVASSLIPAGTGTSGPSRALTSALEEAGLKREQLNAVTATGYGRNGFEGADHIVSELSCHALGAAALALPVFAPAAVIPSAIWIENGLNRMFFLLPSSISMIFCSS